MDGVVSVTETDESGCEGSLSLDVDLLVNGVDELNAIGMSAYPNPVSETLWVDWDMKGEAVTLVIYNVLGEQVFNEFLQSNRTSIDCSDWAEGIYTAKVYDGLEQSLASFSLVVWR
jgi:hypothetical protein